MHDILHDFPVRASAAAVFTAVSSPRGLDAWWTLTSAGEPSLGSEYALGFGPEFMWRARVSRCDPPTRFEFTLTLADEDWTGTRVSFECEERSGVTTVRFSHCGWPHANSHYRTSSFCWAMYLRLLARYVERGEVVPYTQRLED